MENIFSGIIEYYKIEKCIFNIKKLERRKKEKNNIVKMIYILLVIYIFT